MSDHSNMTTDEKGRLSKKHDDTFIDDTELWEHPDMEAIRRSTKLRLIVQLMWLDDVDMRQAVRMANPLGSPKEVGAALWYANLHKTKIDRAVAHLRMMAFTQPLELAKMVERAGAVGLQGAEAIKLTMERGYEIDPSTQAQIPI